MTAPELAFYPGPKERGVSNTFWVEKKPGGDFYQRELWNGSAFQHVHAANDLKPSIAGRHGDRILAAWGGRVLFAEPWTSAKAGTWGNAFGNRILIQHSGRHRHGNAPAHTHSWWTFYAHLEDIEVQANQVVRGGQHIGDLGGSSNLGRRSLPPHCHFEVDLNASFSENRSGRRLATGAVDIDDRVERARQRA